MGSEFLRWRNVQVSNSFSATTGHALAYDHNQNNIYLFRGTDATGGLCKTWICVKTYGEIPSPRSGAAAVAVAGKLYMFGGYSQDMNKEKKYFNDLYELHLETYEWRKIEPIGFGASTICPRGRTDHTMLFYNGKLLVFGGTNGKNKFNDVYAFSLLEHQWFLKGRSSNFKPCCRFGHSAIIYKDCMYVFGGWDGKVTLNCFWCFHVDMERWSQVLGDTEYVFGIDEDYEMVSSRKPTGIRSKVLLLKGMSTSFRRRKKDDFLPMEGLEEPGFEEHFGHANSYKQKDDPATWTTWPDSRYRHSGVVDEDGDAMIIFGGINHNNELLQGLLKYDFTRSRWTKVITKDSISPCARTFHSTVFASKKSLMHKSEFSYLNLNNVNSNLCNSFIYVVGGYNGKKLLNDVYELEIL